jgi:DNA-binding transcriptional LysR family regulator
VREVNVLLAQIEGLVETVRSGSLTRASRSLYVTQPALTARLKTLEDEVGSPLLVRTRRGVRPTDAGRAFLPHAERALRALEDGRRAIADVREGVGGDLTLGAAPAVSTYLLPGVLRRFALLNPGVRLTVRTGHSEEILEMVLRDEVGLGLVRELHHPDVETIPLYEDELVLVTDPHHRLAVAGAAPVGELSGERVVMFDRTSSYHVLTSALFREAGVAPSAVMELDNIEAAKKMVEQGLGVALLPRIAVSGELASGALRGVEIVGAPPIRRLTVAIRRRDAGVSSVAVSGFLEIVEAMGGGPRHLDWQPSIDPRA